METKEKKTMMDYIADCPEYIRRNEEKSRELTKPLVDEYINGGYKNIWIVACGSSHNGCQCARHFIRRHLGCEVKVVTPFTFVNSEHDLADSDMVVVVSQSGYSVNAINALKMIRGMGRRAIGLTGDLDSDFKYLCDVMADYGVGRETVGYVTRGVTTLALFFMLFTVEAALSLGTMSQGEADELKSQFLAAAAASEEVQKTWPVFFERHYKDFSGMFQAYVCGVGPAYGVALEGALKFGETISLPTAAYETEEYIHGPNIQLNPEYTVFLIDCGEGSERTHEIFEGTKIVTSHVFMITNNEKFEDDNIFHVPGGILPEITPLYYLPVFQITAYRVADDLSRWNKHPLEIKMEKAVSAKSEGYANSPFREDTPGRNNSRYEE